MACDFETLKYQTETFIFVVACMTHNLPNISSLLPSTTADFPATQDLYMPCECVRVIRSVRSGFFFPLLGLFLSSNLVVTGWSGGVLNFIFRHRCIHTYIEMKMWRNRLFLCYELVFAYTLFSFFTPFLRFVETCVHTKSCISILKYGFPCLNVCETVLLFVAKKRNKKNVLCVLKHANRLKALIMYFPT